MSGADLAALAVPPATERSSLIAQRPGCERAKRAGWCSRPTESLSGQVLASGEAVAVDDFRSDRGLEPTSPGEPMPLGSGGPAAAGRGRRRCAACSSVGRARARVPFPRQAVTMLTTFAAQAAIALELAERRQDAERLALLEDRDRIARDLHDLVIQRLFATGMTLQSAVPLIARPEVADRVSSAVDDLDDTIREIRSTIFALQSHGGRSGTACGPGSWTWWRR